MWHFRTLSVSLGFIDIYRGIPLDKDHARCQRSVRNLTRDQKQISQMKKALRFLSIRSPNPKFLATKSYRTWHNFHVKFYYAHTFQHRNIWMATSTCWWQMLETKCVGEMCWSSISRFCHQHQKIFTNIKLPNRFVTSSIDSTSFEFNVWKRKKFGIKPIWAQN